MTALLLDTHVFAWAVGRPDRLPKAVAETIDDPQHRLVVSSVSAWEITAKMRLGRWPEAEILATQFADVVQSLGAVDLAITTRHTLRAGQLAWAHRDPFDRILAAQALLDDLTLVTSDAAFSTLGGLRVLW